MVQRAMMDLVRMRFLLGFLTVGGLLPLTSTFPAGIHGRCPLIGGCSGGNRCPPVGSPRHPSG